MARYDRGYGGRAGRGYDRGLRSERLPSRRHPGAAESEMYGFMPDSRPPYDRGYPRFGPHRDGYWQQWEASWPDDEEVRLAVRRSLFEDRWLDASAIEVQVEDGVVTLSGEVPDYLEARYAWDDAWDTEGVEGVISRLVVRSADEADTAGEEVDTPG